MIEFLTDLEGCFERFESYLRKSDIFFNLAQAPLGMKPGTHFVYGGDALDRGPQGIKILSLLIDLKERYPEQVTLLLGNRDLNKMRLVQEIREMGIDPRTDFLGSSAWSASRYAEALSRIQNRLRRMNAGHGFEFRREELALQSGEVQPISDEQVLKSLLGDLEPEGLLDRYYQLGQLAVVIEENLFTHGSIREENLGLIPRHSGRITDIREWVETLNHWAQDQIRNWERNLCESNEKVPGEALLLYQQPRVDTPGRNDLSVVYGRNADENNNSWLPKSIFLEGLKNQGIYRSITGHTPQGDAPSVFREKDFEVVIGDISYSIAHEGPKIQIEGKHLRVDTLLPSGELLRIVTQLGQESWIGQKVASGHWVQGQFSNGDFLLFRYQDGFKPNPRRVSQGELEKLGLTKL